MNFCTDCYYCSDRKHLLRVSKDKRKKKQQRAVICNYNYDCPLAPNMKYIATCWNARKHSDLCGIEGKNFKKHRGTPN